MHDGAVAAGVLARKLVAVQAVGDRLTDVLRIGREHAAVELDLAVAVAHVGGVGSLAFLHQVEAGVDRVAAGAAVQQVDGAAFELVHHRVGGDGLDDQRLNGRLHAAVVADKLGVRLQGSLLAGLVKVVEQVRAAGDLRVVAVTGLHVVDRFLKQLGGEVAGDGRTVLGVLNVALRRNHVQRTRTEGGVGDVVVVRELLRLDGEGVGHVVHQMHAGESVGGAVEPLVIADIGVTGVAGVAVHAGHLVAVLQQHREDVVLRGDRGAVAPDQAVVDRDGVGLGAVLVLGLLVARNDRIVVLELAFLAEDDGVVAAVDQVVHVVVRLRGGEPGVVELIDDLGDGADDHLAGRLGRALAGAQI